MKNIPIIGKFLSILAIFGVFVLLVTFYSTNEMRFIEKNNNHLISGPIQALIFIARADRSITGANVDIAQLVIDTNVSNHRTITANIDYHKSSFKKYMAQAAGLDPADARDILILQNKGLQILNGDCASAIQLGAMATSPTDGINAQKVYLGACSAKLAAISDNITEEMRRFVSVTGAGQASLTAWTGSTILTSFAAVISGLVLVMLIGFFAVRAWVTRPLKQQLGTMGRLSSGDYEAEVAGAERGDEIGAIGRAVQVFKDAGVEKLRMEAEAQEQRAPRKRRASAGKPSAKPRRKHWRSCLNWSGAGWRSFPPAICCSA